MTTQFAIAEDYGRNSLKQFVQHETELPNAEARLAMLLIEKWGMVAAKSAGEDSAGRSMLVDLSPAEVVERACSIAEKALAAFRERNWIVIAPDISELQRASKD
jgi:hypothetical protein